MKEYPDYEEVTFSDIEGTDDEAYDPWDEIVDKIDNGEEL